MASPKAVRELIDAYGFTFRRSLGQNFLVDGNVLRGIVGFADIGVDDTVVEIGAGIGSLTRALASRARRVLALEIDGRLHSLLAKTLSDYNNVELFCVDALTVDWVTFWQEHSLHAAKIVANLPYYITSSLLVNLLLAELPWQCMVLMMQKEVADRLTAKPGTRSYGTVTALANYYASVRVCQLVPATVFMPPPAVDSAIVRFVGQRSCVQAVDSHLLWQVIKAAFAQRRKTVANSLASALLQKGSADKNTLEGLLRTCGIDPRRRAETLTVREFVVFSNLLANYCMQWSSRER